MEMLSISPMVVMQLEHSQHSVECVPAAVCKSRVAERKDYIICMPWYWFLQKPLNDSLWCFVCLREQCHKDRAAVLQGEFSPADVSDTAKWVSGISQYSWQQRILCGRHQQWPLGCSVTTGGTAQASPQEAGGFVWAGVYFSFPFKPDFREIWSSPKSMVAHQKCSWILQFCSFLPSFVWCLHWRLCSELWVALTRLSWRW